MKLKYTLLFILIYAVFSDVFGQRTINNGISLTRYTYDPDDLSKPITEIIVPAGVNWRSVLLDGDGNLLFIKNGYVFVKKKYRNKIADLDKVLFNISIKNKVQNSFTMVNNHFHKNKVIAHRGAWKGMNTSENSIASLKEAIKMGCFGSETDVHLTADSVLVINHDGDWGGQLVQKSTLAALRKTPLSNGEQLPLLKDFLKIIKSQTGTKLILELKSSDRGREWANTTVARVLQLIRDMQAQAWMVYISFDYEICKEILRVEPSANVQYLNGDKTPLQLKADGIRGADYHYTVFQKHPEWIKEAKDNGVDLNAWTVNDAKTMQWLLNENFEYITTNEPKLLFEVIGKEEE